MTGGFHDAFPIVYTRDLARSLAFYRDTLGFEQKYRWPPEGEPDFVVLRLEQFELGLSAASAPRELLGREMGDEPRFELCVYADDTDAAAERLRAAGARELAAPRDYPWGERLAYFEDVEGNAIHVTARR